MDFWTWGQSVSIAMRRRQAADRLASLRKKGRAVSPVQIAGRQIATTFWGTAWCENLERYSDFASRLPRGRSYVRHGCVLDLRIEPGDVKALVSGSDIYDVHIDVAAVSKPRWRAICRDCTGAIDSVVELLQGRLSAAVMTRICEPATGLFPAPTEISFQCSCPDSAWMCKHVAAVLYGIGARLDQQPELLFLLRSVDQQELITKAGAGLRPEKTRSSARVLDTGDLSEIFGIEIAAAPRRAVETPIRKTPATHAGPEAVRPRRGAPSRSAAPRRKVLSAGPRKRRGRGK